ncbi:hypothetical protein VHEMI08764 [[Torrubiella] hemipterigena]|uniref:Kinesin-like protein n=1 Tax=[Torrubiella] hemipterigena TaxID=1531966 RepID=A0A0A1TEI6_9HYPO|nr:hypothetical protein VHEMI08764 [[Torrubiella] hemipterigena]
MNVFVRWRSRIRAETKDDCIDHHIVPAEQTSSIPRHAVVLNRKSTPQDKPWKSPFAFHTILNESDTNEAAYGTIVQPLISGVMAGGCCSFFAYGHSGSGKTHTVIGSRQELKSDLGLCMASAREMFDQITQQHEPLAVGLAAFELRQKAAFDLLNNGKKCHIREGSDEKVHIRGETECLPGGQVRVQPIVKRPCWTYEEFCTVLLEAVANRAVGSSSVHDESSRTHLVLELEIINQSLIDARAELINRESELVPVGKRAIDITVEEQTKSVFKDANGIYKPRPGFKMDMARINAAEAEKALFEDRVKEAEAAVSAVYAKYSTSLGGRMVFVDLAGSEYQQDSASSKNRQTAAERVESRRINTDLLALKEVMRAWSTRQARVPYRSSPLTMVLRETFRDTKGRNSNMVVTVSPTKVHYASTLNSLKYGSLVGTVA